jgi:hypothetical protein
MEAVAAVGSKCLTSDVGDAKSLDSPACLSFFEDRPEELMETLRWRDTGW